MKLPTTFEHNWQPAPGRPIDDEAPRTVGHQRASTSRTPEAFDGSSLTAAGIDAQRRGEGDYSAAAAPLAQHPQPGRLLAQHPQPGRLPGKLGVTDKVQRIVDLSASAIGLAILFPLFLIVAVAIKLTSRGPILFSQERVGLDGASFRLFKFRSMVRDAELLQAELWSENEREGPVFKIRNDPRITRIGHVLRRYSIDELPQLLNVVKGDMSLVGPRPALPLEVAMYTPWQMQRLSVIPGITGLWQISGRADLSFEESVELDLHYIRTRSVRLNVSILLRTIPMVLKAEGAY